MSINPNNYPGASVTVVGFAAGPAEVREFNSGNSQAELSIPVNEGYKKDGEFVQTGTTWYKLIASADYAADNWPAISKGDKVRVDDGKLEAREFERKDGTKGQAFEIRYGTLTVVESKGAAKSDGFTPEASGGGFV